MAKRRALIVLFMVFSLLGLSTINAMAAGTPPPPVNTTPTPTPPGGGIVNSITQVFHHLVFPAETISEALAGIFNRAASKEAGRMNKEIAKWTS